LHEEGDLASARAAAACRLPFVLSTVSSFAIEDVAAAMGAASRWFQLYPGKDRKVMESLLKRAEGAGFGAIVVTVDTTMLGWRIRDLRHQYLPFLHGQGMANFFSDPVFCSRLNAPPDRDLDAAVAVFLDLYVNPAFDWNDFAWIRETTSLPLVVKGLLHPDDASLALDRGADAIEVSNHGGRQLDGAIAALDALRPIVEAVGDRAPVLMDSGIRTGADIQRALSLGATAVLLGRPYAYGLAVAGERGVRTVLDNLLAELDIQMALSGCCTPEDLKEISDHARE
jgi:isopentenyl diphosphate isomerase/L-lactate dehydrogenase-like FMN-dependent dehydrogenase